MAIDIVKFIKGILVKNDTDTSKQMKIEVSSSATTATTTTLQSAQTSNVTVTLPNATDTLVGRATTDTLTNKSFDADGTGNSITNIENADIKAGAAIDATKIANGTVSNTEFQYLDGVTSSIQTQIGNITGSAVTSLTGDVTATGPGAAAATIANGAVTDVKVATGISATKIGAGVVDNTEFGYLDGVTSAIQTQINSKQDASTAVTLTGAQTLTNKTLQFLRQAVATDSTTTGSNATLSAFTTGVVRLTDASLASISGIPAGVSGQQLVLENKTGAAITVKNADTGASAADRILTGTNASITMFDNATFVFTYDATSSRWMLSSGSGAGASTGPINYITFGNAEADTLGWATYKDAAGALPVDGTGGSPTLTITAGASNPLRGAKSYFINKSASNQQGEGVSYDFTIDAADKGKVLQISFDYAVYAGTYADGDIGVYIYDVTNGTVIQPAGFRLQNVIGNSNQKATFQTAINSTSYRLIFHVASTSAVAYTIQFDNVVTGPQVSSQGFEVSAVYGKGGAALSLTAGTPADLIYNQFSADTHGAYNTTTGIYTVPVTGYYHINASAYVQGTVTANAELHVNDTSNNNIARMATTYPLTGANQTGLLTGSVGMYLQAGFQFKIRIYIGAGSSLQVYADGETTRLYIKGPSLVPASDTDTRVVAASYRCGSGQSLTSTGIIKFDTKVSDTHGAYNTTTGVYTAPVAGLYKVNYFLTSITATAQATIQLRKNGTTQVRVAAAPQYSGGTSIVNNQSVMIQNPYIMSLNAGDTVDVYNSVALGTGSLYSADIDNYLSIERLSGPSTIAASETVSFSANTSTTAGTTSTPFIYTTKEHDTHNAYSTSTGKFTAPIAGKYCFQFNNFGGATTFQAKLHKNGTAVYQGSSTVAMVSVGSGSHTISMLAGDTMEVRPETNATASGGATTNTFSGFRVGN